MPHQQSADSVNHPPHYGGADNPYEAIKVIEAWELDFCLGNAVKYIARAGKKNENVVEDLQKAMWYINRRIEQVLDAGDTQVPDQPRNPGDYTADTIRSQIAPHQVP